MRAATSPPDPAVTARAMAPREPVSPANRPRSSGSDDQVAGARHRAAAVGRPEQVGSDVVGAALHERRGAAAAAAVDEREELVAEALA